MAPTTHDSSSFNGVPRSCVPGRPARPATPETGSQPDLRKACKPHKLSNQCEGGGWKGANFNAKRNSVWLGVLLGPLPSPHLLFPLFPFPCSSLPACCVVSRLVAQKLMLRRRVGRGGADDPIVPFDQPEAFVNIIGFGVLLGSLLAGCVTEDWYGILKTEKVFTVVIVAG